MSSRLDIDQALAGWEYAPGELSVRLIEAEDHREVIQMRVELGVLQMEPQGRPDGTRPEGAESYLDYLLALSIHEGELSALTDEQSAQVDREFAQYYHRRICWLALRKFSHAVADADHTLALMDVVRSASPDEEWTASHEQYRPFVLFHRTQAAALAQLDEESPERAIEEINRGLDTMHQVFRDCDVEDQFEEDQLVEKLRELRESLRKQHDVGQTLKEQLAAAVASEQYERAANLRDEIQRRGSIDPPGTI